MTLILALVGWPTLARRIRGKLLSLRGEDYIIAASDPEPAPADYRTTSFCPLFTSYIIVDFDLFRFPVIIGLASRRKNGFLRFWVRVKGIWRPRPNQFQGWGPVPSLAKELAQNRSGRPFRKQGSQLGFPIPFGSLVHSIRRVLRLTVVGEERVYAELQAEPLIPRSSGFIRENSGDQFMAYQQHLPRRNKLLEVKRSQNFL